MNLILLAKWVGTYSQCDWLPIFVLKLLLVGVKLNIVKHIEI